MSEIEEIVSLINDLVNAGKELDKKYPSAVAKKYLRELPGLLLRLIAYIESELTATRTFAQNIFNQLGPTGEIVESIERLKEVTGDLLTMIQDLSTRIAVLEDE